VRRGHGVGRALFSVAPASVPVPSFSYSKKPLAYARGSDAVMRRRSFYCRYSPISM
jgi:hypothetical protein